MRPAVTGDAKVSFPIVSDHLNRRQFLQEAAGAVLSSSSLACLFPARTARPSEQNIISFFAIGDTHFFANEQSPDERQEASVQVCGRLIETLNLLPGTEIPQAAGGGKVGDVRGVIHAGDIIDTGDKRGAVQERMQRTEWDAYTAEFGLTGTEGKLKLPVFEVHGNHDSPGGDGLAIDGLRERSRKRQVASRSANDLHYSWDWGPVHFINLGIVVGQDPKVTQRRRYNPLDSLDFLSGDLQQHVGNSRRPVVITHHIDVLRYSQTPDPNDERNLGMEWNPCDVRAYYEAIRNYNIAGVIYGHTHVRNIQPWDGTATKAEQGITLLNVDNASHFSGPNQAFFYIEIDERELSVRECATKDAWTTFEWTPQVWKRPLPG
jgi:predicted phosphodiesterase